MTFDAQETSRYAGKPIEAYRFAYGANEFLYTSADDSIDVDVAGSLKTFYPTAIASTAPDLSQEDVSGAVTITLPHDDAVAQLFLGSMPVTPVGITIYRRHEDDSSQVITFNGRVAGCDFQAKQARIRCVPISGLLDRTVPPLKCSRLCNWVTYSPECGVNKASFTDAGTVSGVVGMRVRAAVFASRADGWFTNGWIEKADGTRGAIASHAGEYVTLLTSMPGLLVGDAISAIAGDDFTEDTCRNKFSNVVNFSGFPRQPDRNQYELGMA